MIAALFVQRNGCYWNLPDVDPWDEERDARRYYGPWPVVAHPPCARWCRLAGQMEQRHGLKRGDDGGCFASALDCVRGFGGVLEHPAFTEAFAAHGLPAPDQRGGWQRTLDGGAVCHVDQGHYGHRVNKPTWLYAHGVNLPDLRWGPANIENRSPRTRTGQVQLLSKKQRIATPHAFRDLLISMAKSVERRQPKL